MTAKRNRSFHESPSKAITSGSFQNKLGCFYEIFFSFGKHTHKISNYDHIKFIRCVLIPKNILSFRNHSTFLITYDHIKFVGCVLIPKNTLSLRKHWHLELWSNKVTYKLGRLIKSTKYSFIPESFNISKWKPSGSLQMGLFSTFYYSTKHYFTLETLTFVIIITSCSLQISLVVLSNPQNIISFFNIF